MNPLFILPTHAAKTLSGLRELILLNLSQPILWDQKTAGAAEHTPGILSTTKRWIILASRVLHVPSLVTSQVGEQINSLTAHC